MTAPIDTAGCIWDDCDQQAAYCPGHAREYMAPETDALRAENKRLLVRAEALMTELAFFENRFGQGPLSAAETTALHENRMRYIDALCRARAAVVAQDEHCKDCCCARSWQALGVSEYTGFSIPEHIEALRAERDSWKQQAMIQAESLRLSNLEVERLRDIIDKACNALTDSIQVSGNDRLTNMHWVCKLRAALEGKP